LTGMDWGIVLDVGVGVGVLLVGIGVLWGMAAVAKTLGRVNRTLDEVDSQLKQAMLGYMEPLPAKAASLVS